MFKILAFYMCELVKCLGARNSPTPPTHTCHPLNLSKSSALSSYLTFFCCSLLSIIARFFLIDTFNASSVYLEDSYKTACMRVKILNESFINRVNMPVSLFRFSLSPVLFSWHDRIMCVRKENDIQPSWKRICAFCQSKPCVCVHVSVRIETDIHPQVIREKERRNVTTGERL